MLSTEIQNSGKYLDFFLAEGGIRFISHLTEQPLLLLSFSIQINTICMYVNVKMITCLTKLILFIISIWEVCRAWLASGCWRVCLISVGGRLLFTAVVKWKQIYVCWQSQQWLQTMGSLHVCIPTSDRNACTVSSSFLLVLGHFLTVFLLKRSALALLPVCVRGVWERSLTAPTQLCVCIAHLSPWSSWVSLLNVAKCSGGCLLLCLLSHI